MPDTVIKSVGANACQFSVGAPNTAVIITMPVSRSRQEIRGSVVWSYSADPTGGRLTITGGGFAFDVDITTGGPGFIPFTIPAHSVDDNPLVFTLAAAGGVIVGKLNIMGVVSD